MTTIFAELTAPGDQLVLVAGGVGHDVEDVAVAARQLKLLTPLFTKSDPPGALIAPATWPAVVQLSATFGERWRPGPRLVEWITARTAARTSGSTAPLTYTPPAGMTPYPWQAEGAALIAATGRALITDEPGTGKTITTILGLVERLYNLPIDHPVLVVCPASVVDPWVEAWKTWAPHVRAVAWRGTPKKRHALAGTADVYVTSYDLARADAPPTRMLRPLLDLEPGHLVVDESHLIKNHQTARSKAVRRIADAVDRRGGTIVALSGTPITHHPADLWPSLVALDPGAWPSRERWVNRYCQVLDTDYGAEILGLEPSREAEFRLTLLGQHRRVAKADVLSQLPPKVHSVRTVDLPPKWRKAYDEMESQMLAELPDGTELSVMSLLAKLTRLAQLAAAPAHVETTEEVNEQTGKLTPHVKVTLEAPSWKVDALLEVLAERPGEPVVAFAPSRQLIDLAGAAAAEAGLKVGYVVGGQTASERTAHVEAFQRGELDLICVTTGAGGVGITLTAAKTCVFLQRPWSIVEALQAEDRCHRIGSEQHDAIEVIDIVARNTIDTRVRAVLRERAGALSDLVQDPRIAAEILGGSTDPERKSA